MHRELTPFPAPRPVIPASEIVGWLQTQPADKAYSTWPSTVSTPIDGCCPMVQFLSAKFPKGKEITVGYEFGEVDGKIYDFDRRFVICAIGNGEHTFGALLNRLREADLV